MQLFILIPTVKDQNRWLASDYLGEVIVRAQNPEEARALAAMEYTHGPRRARRGTSPVSPWHDSSEVVCEPYVGWEYPRQGNPAILYPPEFRA